MNPILSSIASSWTRWAGFSPSTPEDQSVAKTKATSWLLWAIVGLALVGLVAFNYFRSSLFPARRL